MDLLSILSTQWTGAYSKVTMPAFIGLKLWFREPETSSHFEWPAQSPKPNPNENLWDVLEKDLCNGPTPQTSIQDLGEKKYNPGLKKNSEIAKAH